MSSVLHCGECGAENPPETKFCTSCGTPLAITCPGCGSTTQPGAQFCGECGTKLSVPGASREATPAARDEPEPSDERRVATVLFADLSGYTAIAERLDPEDTKAVIDRALGRLSREVVDRGGYIDKYIGDNVMAIFGAPVAHEDDPERAVRAALAMQEAMSEINAEIGARASSRDLELALRVGINSGELMAGRVGDRYTVTGDTVNVAARLQAAGRPGAVTVGPSTRRSTAAVIEYRDLEPLTLKGKSEPIPAWEAVGVIDVTPRSQSRRSEAPLIGRDEELALLLSLFGRVARESRPHLVTVFGQAGVGKSRLLGELASALRDRADQADTLIGRSPPYGTAMTYSALGEIIRERFGISETEAPATVVEKLGAGIDGLRSAGQEVDTDRIAAQIARVLGIDSHAESAEDVDPEQVRDRIFSAVRQLVELVAESSPLVVAIEDIHWADEGMLDLIEHLAGSGGGPVLIICLARDELLERRPSWGGGRRNATTISLDPLSDDEAQKLVQALLSGEEGGRELAERVARRSGGNPLFAEEMVNRLREEGSDDVDELPDSVHAVLAARLDALEPKERRLMQAASVVGQSFWEETVGELTGGGPVGDSLAALVNKDLLSSSTTSRLAGEREFTFKHVLIRDVAYATLPRSVRAQQHFDVAQIIEARVGTNREGVALLAEHYGRAAGLAEQAGFPATELEQMRAQAAHAFEAAGDVAASLYSNAEALAHYESALRLPAALEPGERARIEESRGDTAFRAGHVGAAIEAWTRAQEAQQDTGSAARVGELHRKIGSGLWQKGDREASIARFQQGIDLLKDGDPCRELVGLYEEAASLYVETGDNMLAIYAAEKAQSLAEALGQSSTASRAHLTFGRVFGRIGDFEQARKSLERSVELARQTGPGEAIRALLALSHHLEVAEADYPAATKACDEALALADQVGDVPAEIELRGALGQLAVHPAAWSEVDEHAAAAARLAEREGLAGQLCLPLLLQGISAWRRGDWQDAEARLQRSHGIATAGGRSEVAVLALLWLAACKRDRGDYRPACEALVQAADICDRAGLIAQSAEAIGARVAALSLDGRNEEAGEAAAEVEQLLQRATHPVGLAAAAEARGVTADAAGVAAQALGEAAAQWAEAGRPLNAIRARLLLARSLREDDAAAAVEVLEEAVAEAERLGVPHLAAAARAELARA